MNSMIIRKVLFVGLALCVLFLIGLNLFNVPDTIDLYAQEQENVVGAFPKSWGEMREIFYNDKYLSRSQFVFEDSDGTIRIVYGLKPNKVIVIKRN